MKENVMRSLTENEMEATFGGETWGAKAWKCLKNMFSLKHLMTLMIELEEGLNFSY